MDLTVFLMFSVAFLLSVSLVFALVFIIPFFLNALHVVFYSGLIFKFLKVKG